MNIRNIRLEFILGFFALVCVLILAVIMLRVDDRFEKFKELCYPGMVDRVDSFENSFGDKILLMCTNGKEKWVIPIDASQLKKK